MNFSSSYISSLFKFKQKRVDSPADSSSVEAKNSQQTEIVYVKHVKEGGPAYLAGLREGDCPISIDNVPLGDKPYTNIVPIIENRYAIYHFYKIHKFI